MEPYACVGFQCILAHWMLKSQREPSRTALKTYAADSQIFIEYFNAWARFVIVRNLTSLKKVSRGSRSRRPVTRYYRALFSTRL